MSINSNNLFNLNESHFDIKQQNMLMCDYSVKTKKSFVLKIQHFLLSRRNRNFFLLFLSVFSVFVLCLDYYHYTVNLPEYETYSTFVNHLENGEINILYYSENSKEMRYVLRDSLFSDSDDVVMRENVTYPLSLWRRTTSVPDSDFLLRVLENDVIVKYENFRMVTPFILGCIYMCVLVGLPVLYILIRKYNSETQATIQETQSELNTSEILQTSTVTFKDVIGLDETLKELAFIGTLLEDYKRGSDLVKKLDATLPSGILLAGPPGVGKTLVAKAVAGEFGVPFLKFDTSRFIEKYAGVGAKRVQELFALARKNKPCVLFLDEIDAIGRSRDNGGSSTDDERRGTLNQLLVEMDGFSSETGVFVMAATNYENLLDSALKRRFTRVARLYLPAFEDRKRFFTHFLGEYAANIDVNLLAQDTVGFSGSYISNIVNDAKLHVIQESLSKKMSKLVITTKDVEDAIERVQLESSGVTVKRSPEEQKLIEYHESGHALIFYLFGIPVSKATVLGTASTGGYVKPLGNDSILTSTKYFKEISFIAGLAGRAAESLVFGENNITICSESDLKKVTDDISDYVKRFGFCKDCGPLNYYSFSESSELMAQTDVYVKELAVQYYAKAFNILCQYRPMLDKLAYTLHIKESMSGTDIAKTLQPFNISIPLHLD